ncbi:hypothetical protein AeMF1_004648 [Aphanomyces euteiches]|nr:hypothetical protein AeMF1_004648 [Aphanomyces euteiches]KAH9183527.1 hypothetical protein AeNC1_014500 [Aphanomyces euteiches]
MSQERRSRASLKVHYERLSQQFDLVRHIASNNSHDVNPFNNFEEYAASIDVLVRRGSSRDHFQYLFVFYATSEARGITRTELLRLIQDHVDDDKEDPRFFEKMYTWLKRHFQDVKTYEQTIALLETHPAAVLDRVHLNVDKWLVQLQTSNQANALPQDLDEPSTESPFIN